MEHEMKEQALKRLRRKLEIMRLDCRRTSDVRRYDMEECLALVGIIERSLDDADKNKTEDAEGVGDGSGGDVL
jgi:hypothetical protein